jgi:hypothetical protein
MAPQVSKDRDIQRHRYLETDISRGKVINRQRFPGTQKSRDRTIQRYRYRETEISGDMGI